MSAISSSDELQPGHLIAAETEVVAAEPEYDTAEPEHDTAETEVEPAATNVFPAATLPDFPDLSAVPGNELRKLPETALYPIEGDGDLYATIYRQLQIRPDKYRDFHHGVVRVIRSKHQVELRRGS